MVAEEERPLLQETEHDAETGSFGERDDQRPEGWSETDRERDPEVKVPVHVVMLAVQLAAMLVAIDDAIATATHAHVSGYFHHLENTSWIAAGYMLTLTGFQPLCGKLCDIFGRKACMVFALLVFGLGCLLCALANSMVMFVAARSIVGIGSGGIAMQVLLSLSQLMWFLCVNEERGTALPVPSTQLAKRLDRHLVGCSRKLWDGDAMIFATVFKDAKSRPSDFRTKLSHVDVGGAVVLVFAVFTLLLGLDRGGNVAWMDRLTISCLAAFLVLIVAFGVIEWRLAREPFAPKDIVLDGGLLPIFAIEFFSNGAMLVVPFYAVLYLQIVRNFSPTQVGLTLVMAVAGGAVSSVIAGLIIQATGKYRVLSLCSFLLAACGIAIAASASVPWLFSFVGFSAGLAILNAGGFAGITTSVVALVANAGPEKQAVATAGKTAVMALARTLGPSIILSIATTLFQTILRMRLREQLSGDNVDTIIARARKSLDYIKELDPATRAIVMRSYNDGSQVVMWFSVVIILAAVAATPFLREKSLSR
ncbi:uncharacterized protein FIBRA_02714 [Fibroporia radiculosa]|uniref:Major facilitator superfamily (MFS) profile domain-containing protein n=1 Tax=Fibroporia radiculosa TaxID=599839 RepID=J4GN22_9APHY|nr:uncharacterized protein FIBRA_02714 [Fibroporia radiculosa]CCM00675.1 predicted protein [Fibroporia radiculosa]